MTREDIIRMANEVGFRGQRKEISLREFVLLARFATLVAETEREACAEYAAALEAQEDEALLNEPVAMRYDGDGYGYLYIDSGSGSDWQRRHKDAEPLYLAPPKPEPALVEQLFALAKLTVRRAADPDPWSWDRLAEDGTWTPFQPLIHGPDMWRLEQALRAALGAEMSAMVAGCRQPVTEPDAKPKPVAWWHPARGFSWAASDVEVPPTTLPLYAAPPDATHPGYILGAHWLETAYSRIAAGEAEDAVLAEVLSERGWVKPPAKRERATVEQVLAEHGPLWGPSASPAFFSGWRAAERHHKIITMEDK